MKKLAFFDSLTPAQMALLSAMVGGGVFATGRLGQKAYRGITGPPKPEDEDGNISLDVPMVNKQAADGFDEDLQRVILGMGMLPAGFLGAKGLSDHLEAQRNKARLEAEKQKYMQALSGMGAFKQAEASSSPTPIADAFIAKYAEDMEKHAEGVSFEGQPFEVQRQAMNQALKSDIGQRASNYMTSGISDRAMSAAQMLAAVTAMLSGGALIMADRKKAKTEASREYPSNVTVNPVQVPPAQAAAPQGAPVA